MFLSFAVRRRRTGRVTARPRPKMCVVVQMEMKEASIYSAMFSFRLNYVMYVARMGEMIYVKQYAVVKILFNRRSILEHRAWLGG